MCEVEGAAIIIRRSRNNAMAGRTVRKVKRGRAKESANYLNQLPAIIVTPPDSAGEMKIKAPERSEEVRNVNDANLNENTHDTSKHTKFNTMTEFSVRQLIVNLSENSRASKNEIENIQRRLLQQANEIMKVNTFAKAQTITEPRVIAATQKHGSAVYGRIPVAPRNAVINGTPNSVGIETPNHSDTQLVPERLQETRTDNVTGGMNSDRGNMQRVGATAMATADAGRIFFYETSSAARAAASARPATARGGVEGGPPYRMPPAPEAALPGAPAPSAPPTALHTHSAKFPIEREVILSSGEKNSKVPILQEARKRGRLGAVAPDTPPKTLSAWTHAENQQAGTSGDFRQYHDQNYSYAMHQNQNQGAVARNIQNYDSPKPPIPAKNYGTKADLQNNSHHITVTVETGKDNTRDAPKSTKSVSKTYHTLKDMISSRFKGKDSNDNEKTEEPSLNNIEERKRPEPEQVTPRETPTRKVEQGIYGRPMPQARPDMQYSHGMANNMAYPSPSPHRQMMQQQQIVQQQMLLNQQARSQEMLSSTPHSRPQALGADALYQQYGPPGRRSAVYQRDMDVRSMANFTSLKSGPQNQFDNSHSRPDLRSPQQLEREIIRQRGLVEGRRAASHPHLLDEPPQRPEVNTPQIHERSRRNSHGNLLDGLPIENSPQRNTTEERESDDGGFRLRLAAQGRSSFEERIRTSGRSIESHRQERIQDNIYRRTPESHRESRRTPDSLGNRHKEETINHQGPDRNDESASQKSVDSVYNSSGKAEAYHPQPSSSRHTPNRIEDLKAHGKKGANGSGASSDYDKNGGQSSNVDSGRGSVAYSSGRRPEASPHDTSADSDPVAHPRNQPQPGTSQQQTVPNGENEWADLVECELRQILEPKLSALRLDSSASSDGSVTPPLPPLSPSSDLHKRNSLPGRSSEYPEERRRGRESPRWHGQKKHDLKGINKRFQRLESHVVTLARSVAHLSSEMRTQHLVMQEMDNIRAEIAALRHMYKSQQFIRSGHQRHLDPYSFSNPDRVKRLTKFFGDEPPLMRLFLKKLGYEKYAALLEKERVGAAELPYVGEDRLRALGVPLGPRMRILREAGLHHDLRARDDLGTTTLAIV
ncbi:PREDICTED: uncharacterized protein LOC106100865 [Papilio polytes]|uniref:uncharacterized protein LOC106100865 n=1 Tax=Papilio polytes TaxID=76194 RepID=UPI0006764538|nr:PREDICTED: uncharacterized protein LOC106100865 [Papilio polytes]